MPWSQGDSIYNAAPVLVSGSSNTIQNKHEENLLLMPQNDSRVGFPGFEVITLPILIKMCKIEINKNGHLRPLISDGSLKTIC